MENVVDQNFAADWGHVQYLIKGNKISDCNEHLHDMSQKYEDSTVYKQKILLHIAMLYYRANDFESASTNFLEAIELDKDSQVLQEFENEFDNQRRYNIFEFLKINFIPRAKKFLVVSDDLKTKIEKIEENCNSFSPVPCQPSGWLPSGHPRRAFPRQDQTFESHTSDAGWTPSDNAGQVFPRQDKIFPITSDDVGWVPSGHARRSFPRQDQTFSSPSNDEERSRETARNIFMDEQEN